MASPSAAGGYNRNASSVKRILSEAREVAAESGREFHAEPLEDNIFEWHFCLRGPPDTDFAARTLPRRSTRLAAAWMPARFYFITCTARFYFCHLLSPPIFYALYARSLPPAADGTSRRSSARKLLHKLCCPLREECTTGASCCRRSTPSSRPPSHSSLPTGGSRREPALCARAAGPAAPTQGRSTLWQLQAEPRIQLRTQVNTKICLSISQHHPEHWQPSWSVRTALVALIAFLPTKARRKARQQPCRPPPPG